MWGLFSSDKKELALHRHTPVTWLTATAIIWAILSFALFASDGSAFAASPFDTVKGSWKGGGRLTLEGGGGENLHCNAYYTSDGGGVNLSVALRCSGKSKKFELRSHLSRNGGKVSGNWEERTFNASGEASGILRPGALNLHFHGGISGNMSVAFSSSHQAISIAIATSGAVVKGLHIALNRG
jgi:hypothetical protein